LDSEFDCYLSSPSNEHLTYHFKTILLKDVQALLEVLEKNGFGPPSPDQAQFAASVEAYRLAQSEYDQQLAQIIFNLPTHWPPKAHFWADLNKVQSVTMSPKFWVRVNYPN
jgi:hypothetical protein